MSEELKYKSSYKGARMDALLSKVDETKPEGPTNELIANSERLITSGGVKTAVDPKYVKPVGGIPKSDLNSTVQASLDKADSSLQPSNIKQTTGNSQTDVMSQKAVTDALNTKVNKPTRYTVDSMYALAIEKNSVGALLQINILYDDIVEGPFYVATGNEFVVFGTTSNIATGEGYMQTAEIDGHEYLLICSNGDSFNVEVSMLIGQSMPNIQLLDGVSGEDFDDMKVFADMKWVRENFYAQANIPVNEIPVSDGEGDFIGSGVLISDVLKKITSAVNGNFVEFVSGGGIKDSGIPKTKIADIDSQIADIKASPNICEGIADTISDGTPQEFVFRQSGGDGVNYLKRIKGKSLAWNQKMNNSLAPSGQNVIVTQKTTGFSWVGNDLTSNQLTQTNAGNERITGHKYYTSFLYKSNIGFKYQGAASPDDVLSATDSFVRKSYVKECTVSHKWDYYYNYDEKAEIWSAEVKDYIQIDLTLLYGSEIDGLTNAQILAKYEAEFGDKYYPNNDGDLICNDAKYLESAGSNQWDEEWEEGNINGQTGEKQPESGRIRSKNLFPVFGGVNYYMRIPSPYKIRPFYYDANKNFISAQSGYIDAGIISTPTNCAYMMFSASATYGAVYNNDICINLSDPAKNGTYEPYWKRVLPVNCDSFKVKSHNIWDEEWESGSISTVDGSDVVNASNIRTKNYIPIFASTNYYCKSNGSTIGLRFYDANKNFLGSTSVTGQGGIFTTPSNAAFLRFTVISQTTYNNDICINLSGPFNGQYEPHGEITVNGLRGVGTAFDEKTATKYVKRMERVDLGTLSWGRTVSAGTVYYLYAMINDAVTTANDADIRRKNIICVKYTTANSLTSSLSTTLANDKSMVRGNADKMICIRDDSYTDADAFKTAMDGVILYYELATPIEYELVEPCFPAIMVDSEGVEHAIFPEHSNGSPSAPFCCDSNYSISIKNLISALSSLNQ